MERLILCIFIFGKIYAAEVYEAPDDHPNDHLRADNLKDAFEGDILLNPEQKEVMKQTVKSFVEENCKGGTCQDHGVTPKVQDATSKFKVTNVFPTWPNGVIVYQFSGIRRGSAQYNSVTAAMRSWTAKTNGCIKFKERTNERNYLKIFIGNGCNCHLGYPNGESRLSVGRSCEYQHIMEHELGHAIGFWHEQSRPDRDQYLKVLWNNVPAGFREAFAKYGNDKIDSLGVPFDYTSIMQYPWSAFSTQYGKNTLLPLKTVPYPGPYKRISPADILAARRHYGCDKWDKKKGGGGKTKETGECKDLDASQCPGWKKHCASNAWMKTNCKKTCGLCTKTTETCTDGIKNQDETETDCGGKCPACAGGGDCTDSQSSCSGWADKGECTRNPSWMLKNCMKSCKTCPNKKTDPPVTTKPVTAKPVTEKPKPRLCHDNYEFCPFIKTYCITNAWAKANCVKTCEDRCQDKKPQKCSDKNASCIAWSKSGYCNEADYKNYMARTCPCACASV